MSVKNIHCYITGRVQGVYFRASTRDKAIELTLSGWVRNLSDGRVEVMAAGEQHQIDSFIEWLHQGPPMANVEGIEFDETLIEQSLTQPFIIK